VGIVQDETDVTGVSDSDGGRGGSALARARDRKANAALQLRIKLVPWDEVATILGFPNGEAALRATERALEKELRTESRDVLRLLAGRRLDTLLASLWDRATNPEDPDHLAYNAQAASRIAQYAKLMGLDAPTEMIVHSPSESEIQDFVAKVTKGLVPQLPEADIFEGESEVVSDEFEATSQCEATS
jgi:hypothetical protein